MDVTVGRVRPAHDPDIPEHSQVVLGGILDGAVKVRDGLEEIQDVQDLLGLVGFLCIGSGTIGFQELGVYRLEFGPGVSLAQAGL